MRPTDEFGDPENVNYDLTDEEYDKIMASMKETFRHEINMNSWDASLFNTPDYVLAEAAVDGMFIAAKAWHTAKQYHK